MAPPEPGRRAREAGLTLPLATARLELREFAGDDLEAMLAYGGDERVTRYMLYAPRDADAAREHLAAVLRRQRDRPRRAWELAIAERATRQVIGACDLTLVEGHEVDLGWVLARSHWGQGYATEVARALIDAAFRELGAARVAATVDVRNRRSAAVAEKAGLRWEAVLRHHVRARGRWWDVDLYSLSREDWHTQRLAAEGAAG